MREAKRGLAENPALPPSLFERLVADRDEELPHRLAARADLTPAQVTSLLDAGDDEVTRYLVRSGRVAAADLADAPAALPLDAVIGGVARPAVWWEAALDPDPEVRGEVAHEPEAPADVMAALARDPDPAVVASAAANPRLPPALLAELARHPSTAVRENVAAHTSAPPALLAALLADGGRPLPTRCGSWRGCSVTPIRRSRKPPGRIRRCPWR
ncbi:hypothetical protein ACGF1Z_32555 [Streptomyces sp. NPDC048018]|uniref:hypothetical protein n=1 Tax=Streptomyces sp. NPDC048018 TaxID=3365499 RepID=UPI003711F35D